MMGRHHMLSGVVSGSLVAVAGGLPPATAVPFVGITAAGSLLPDIDHPNSTVSRFFLWPGRMLAAIISAIFGHRTLTHSVLGIGLLSAGLAFVPQIPTFCYVAVILGCVTHVLGDMLTVAGVPVFWPHKRVIKIGRMRTGGYFEELVMGPLLYVSAAASLGLLVAIHA